jgi:hypothetical protein
MYREGRTDPLLLQWTTMPDLVAHPRGKVSEKIEKNQETR